MRTAISWCRGRNALRSNRAWNATRSDNAVKNGTVDNRPGLAPAFDQAGLLKLIEVKRQALWGRIAQRLADRSGRPFVRTHHHK
ncbi:hypothetical protein [Sphingobium sp. D43FB]|uniref:hypothetical protein n=1 Tax=Sphingobium sp. D43FB TaxID=2017595 RepID=UPI001596FBCE|nr:hypothetical protein [Sphingobium sp. D43FB]